MKRKNGLGKEEVGEEEIREKQKETLNKVERKIRKSLSNVRMKKKRGG